MRLSFFAPFVALFLLNSCNNKPPQKVEPPCISDKVIVFSETQVYGSEASVKEYEFQGDLVYVFNHGIGPLDPVHTVIDYNCDTIGYLGGLSGNTEINGKDFESKAELQRTLFEN